MDKTENKSEDRQHPHYKDQCRDSPGGVHRVALPQLPREKKLTSGDEIGSDRCSEQEPPQEEKITSASPGFKDQVATFDGQEPGAVRVLGTNHHGDGDDFNTPSAGDESTIEPQEQRPSDSNDDTNNHSTTVVIPMAALVNDECVSAEQVDSAWLQPNSNDKKLVTRMGLGIVLVVIFLVGVAGALITLAVVGGFERGDPGTATPTDSPTVATQSATQTPAPTMSRFCSDDENNDDDSLSCWVQIGPDLESDFYLEHFGASVSLAKNGTRLAVSAPFHDGHIGLQDIGLVRVYDVFNDNEDFVPVGQEITGDFGDKVYGVLSKDGNHLAVAGRYHTLYDQAAQFDVGQVRVFELVEDQLKSSSWELLGEPLYGTEAGDYFGRSVALSRNGTIVAIGSSGHDGPNGEGSGQVKVYSYTGGAWDQVGPSIEGDSAFDWSGGSVSISDDGSVIAVGSENPNDAAGNVRVFRLDSTGEWVRLGDPIEGQSPDDEFGSDTALSADGMIVAAGSWANDGGPAGYERGHVRVFAFDDELETWEPLRNTVNGKSDGD